MFVDIYEGSIYRPPSEAYSLILQATIGCSWNRCTFCVAFQGKEFRAKSLAELERDVDVVHPHHSDTTRIFLADGNALCLPTDELVAMLEMLYSRFKRLERVTIYGGPLDLKEKSVEELVRLRKAGLTMVYFGLESGDDEVLRRVKKGAVAQTMIETALKVKEAGLTLSVIYIIGLGGTELTKEHARETARVINAMDPPYAAALTLMVEPGTAIERDLKKGRLTLLDPREALVELYATVEALELTDCVFRANHASNYVTFRGTLPHEKEAVLAQIDEAMAAGRFKPDLFRRL